MRSLRELYIINDVRGGEDGGFISGAGSDLFGEVSFFFNFGSRGGLSWRGVLSSGLDLGWVLLAFGLGFAVAVARLRPKSKRRTGAISRLDGE